MIGSEELGDGSGVFTHRTTSREAVMTHPSGETSEWELMRRHFSNERLRLYLTETNGDEVVAALLYQWNSRCSAAFWHL